jgi:chorismate dehydratase
MIIAKIDYINLLPFMVFLKKYIKDDKQKLIINAKKSYPSKINFQFKTKRANAAFISSIASRNCNCTNLGIVAHGEVLSVLAINSGYKKDEQSATSNALAKILKIDKQVIIGDKALKYYFESNDKNFDDLAKIWFDKYNLPFVFARFCFNSNYIFYKNLAKQFLNSHTKIPYFIKLQYAKSRGLSTSQIDLYLTKIHYKIDTKASKSLKKFLNETK